MDNRTENQEAGHLSGRICPMCGADEYRHLIGCAAVSFAKRVSGEADTLTSNQKLCTAHSFELYPSRSTCPYCEIERLRAALVEYGNHLEDCPEGSDTGDGMCNCGLSAAIHRGPRE